MSAVTQPKAAKPRTHPFAKQIRKEREIGIHPQHRHRAARLRGPSAAEWEAASKAWDAANEGKP
jgi:hypothetical protein